MKVHYLLIFLLSSILYAGGPRNSNYLKDDSINSETMKIFTKKKLLEFLITGGTPPASFELVQIFDNGDVKSLVGNAWPQGQNQNEIGTYLTSLPQEELLNIKNQISSKLFRESNTYGNLYADSGKEILNIFTEGMVIKIIMSPNAKLPDKLLSFRKLMINILNMTKKFPAQAVSCSIVMEPTGNNNFGNSLKFNCIIENIGNDTVKLYKSNPKTPFQKAFLSYIIQNSNDSRSNFVPLFKVYHTGKQLKLEDLIEFNPQSQEIVLLPKQIIKFFFEDSFFPNGKEEYVLYGVIVLPIEVFWDEKNIILECQSIVPPIKIGYLVKNN